MKVRIKSNRKITLPAQIVKEFQFEKGNFLDIEEIDGNLVLKPAKPNLTQK